MSSDCQVFLTHSELQKVYLKESVGLGCDVSNGDSGSSVFDRETGELVCLIWGRKGSMLPFSSKEIKMMSENSDYNPLLRNELSYMIPIEKISKHLELI